MSEQRTVLCGASAYEQKYYFNQDFQALPDGIKEELRILCVLFTEEVGGILTLHFEADGTLALEVAADEEDLLYDEIGSGLLVKEVRQRKQELFESLELFYRIFILKEDSARILEEE